MPKMMHSVYKMWEEKRQYTPEKSMVTVLCLNKCFKCYCTYQIKL